MIESSILTLLLLAFLGSVAGLVGSVIYFVHIPFSRRFCGLAVPFAAGVLLTVSFLDLLPEAVELVGERAFIVALIAFLAAFLFEEFFAGLHHHEHRGHTMTKTAVPLVLAGDTIHNFIDGVAIASAFVVDPSFGLVVSFATFLHETPHEIGDFGILINAGWSRSRALLANLFSASATFPGALMVYFFATESPSLEGTFLAISAGLFLYLGATDFLPSIHDNYAGQGTKIKVLVLLLGVAIMSAVIFGVPHGHM